MISSADLFLVLFLGFLETILSIDNALVLALLARGLPQKQQRKALTSGLAGAVVFRLIALFVLTALMKWTWVRFLGGGYLVFIAIRHFVRDHGKTAPLASRGRFWKTVLIIELTDIAFAVDSILAAVALTPKIWIVFAGGFIGVIVIRFAATGFLSLLRRFPSLETTAYLLVLTIGVKVILEATRCPVFEFHAASAPAFWVLWGTMATFVAYGFWGKTKRASSRAS